MDQDVVDIIPNVRAAASHPAADVLINLARGLEAAEMRIKNELLAAARLGDMARIERLVTRWLEGPVSEVLPPTSEPESCLQAGKAFVAVESG